MPDFGQLASLQDSFHKAMNQRQMANYFNSKGHSLKSPQEQMESQELFVVLPNVVVNEETVKLGEVEEITTLTPFNEYAFLPFSKNSTHFIILGLYRHICRN